MKNVRRREFLFGGAAGFICGCETFGSLNKSEASDRCLYDHPPIKNTQTPKGVLVVMPEPFLPGTGFLNEIDQHTVPNGVSVGIREGDQYFISRRPGNIGPWDYATGHFDSNLVAIAVGYDYDHPSGKYLPAFTHELYDHAIPYMQNDPNWKIYGHSIPSRVPRIVARVIDTTSVRQPGDIVCGVR